MTAALTVEFDDSLAKSYPPRREVKQAVLVPVPEDVETTIVPEWGGEQKFKGSWYAIYEGAQVAYGSARAEFDDSHGSVDDCENGYVKTEPILAYRYSGPTATVVTRLANGHVETKNTVEDGKWMVRWKNGEVGTMTDAKFRSKYVVD